MATLPGLLPTDTAALFEPHELYQVVAVSQTQTLAGDGSLVDAIDIAFAIHERPGVFTYTTPLEFFEVFAPFIGLEARARQVLDLYAL